MSPVVEINAKNINFMNEMKNKIIVKMETYECTEVNDIIIFYLSDNFTKDSLSESYYVNRIVSYYNNTFYYETFKSIQKLKQLYNLDNENLSDLIMEDDESTVPDDCIDEMETEASIEEDEPIYRPSSPVFEPQIILNKYKDPKVVYSFDKENVRPSSPVFEPPINKNDVVSDYVKEIKPVSELVNDLLADLVNNISLDESKNEVKKDKKSKKTDKKEVECNVEVIKCFGVYKNGNKCKNNSKYNGYCGIHSKNNATIV